VTKQCKIAKTVSFQTLPNSENSAKQRKQCTGLNHFVVNHCILPLAIVIVVVVGVVVVVVVVVVVGVVVVVVGVVVGVVVVVIVVVGGGVVVVVVVVATRFTARSFV
jgi:uncharacterized membrane protein